MINSFLGVLLAFFIGSSCRYFDVPLPAPPKLTGALLVLTMTGGYIIAASIFG